MKERLNRVWWEEIPIESVMNSELLESRELVEKSEEFGTR
jgi:hypothetical protein